MTYAHAASRHLGDGVVYTSTGTVRRPPGGVNLGAVPLPPVRPMSDPIPAGPAGDGVSDATAVVALAPSAEAAPLTDAETPDSPTPGQPESPLLVVGLGASAGGIEALERFFRALPDAPGAAFVVVLHLSPDHESHLAEVLQRATAMPVMQVRGTVMTEAGHVYVIPPGHSLSMAAGALRLSWPADEAERRAPVDIFFRTLGLEHRRCAAVVFSGLGADGSVGIKQIREVGGLILAQDPADAAHDGMPRSAIETGLVDDVLPAERLAARIAAYAAETVRLPDASQTLPESDVEALVSVLVSLRLQTGHDFAHYKRATVLRRIGRRMHVHGAPTLAAYAEIVRERPDEAAALLQDLLISVTNFFRDHEAFRTLEAEVVPRLFDGKGPGDTVRVWSAGCATGEEAYGLAILLDEHAATLERPPEWQVFASDIDDDSLARAREGCYSEAIVADVSDERLARFFTAEAGHYVVRKELREQVLFASHSLIKDPPFSRVDLVVCRNLLIYLQREVQARAFEMFHFALRPGGYLFLGASESVDTAAGLFRPVNAAHRVFQRQPTTARTARALPSMPAGPAPARRPLPVPSSVPPRVGALAGDLHQNLLEAYAPPSAVVDERHDIVHLTETAGRFLHVPGGVPTANIVRSVVPELQLELRLALHRAFQQGRPTVGGPVRARLAGEDALVLLIVRPVPREDGEDGLALVLFAEVEDELAAVVRPDGPAGPLVATLEAELNRSRERLQATAEEHETSMEELRASNEELQSMNEEYRSATEEIETSREEIQSVNEELETVNQELKARMDDLTRVHSDLEHLMASTEIGTLFVDRDLFVRRYTPPVAHLFDMTGSDRGRPLGHITHRLHEADLTADAAGVLASLVPVEREVRTHDGETYLVRIRPYRAVDDRIEGVVLTFVDITERTRAEAAMRERAARVAFRLSLGDALRPLTDPAEIKATATRLLGEHVGASRVHYGEIEDNDYVVVDRDYTDGAESLVGRFRMDSFNPALFRAHDAGQIIVTPDVAESASLSREDREAYAAVGVAAQICVPLVKGGALLAVLAVHQNAPREWTDAEASLAEETAEQTWAALAAADLAASETRLRLATGAGGVAVGIWDLVTGRLHGDARLAFLYGLDEAAVTSPEGIDSAALFARVHPDDLPGLEDASEREIAQSTDDYTVEYRAQGADGAWRWLQVRAGVERAAAGQPLRFAGAILDVTARVDARAALRAEADRATFRSALADALRPLTDPVEVQEVAARLLGEHLGVDRAFYAEVDPDSEHVRVASEYASGLPGASTVRTYTLSDYGPAVAAEYRAGRTRTSENIGADPQLTDGVKAAYAAIGIGAYVGVPLVKRGRLVGLLEVNLAAPCIWTAEEVALVEEVAERTWADVERARAEAAVRESEERLHLLVEGAQEYAFVGMDIDGCITTWSAGAERIFGWSEAEATGEMIQIIFTPDDQAAGAHEREMAVAAARGQAPDERWHVRNGGERFWGSGTMNALRDDAGTLRGYAKVLRDNTKRRADEEALRTLNETLDARVTERTQALEERTEQARALAGALTLAEQHERDRIAQVLHDHVQQLLYGVQIKLQLLSPDDPEAVSRDAGEIGALVLEALQTTRSLTVELSPPVLHGEGLTAALRWLATQMEETHGLRVSVEATGDDTALAEERRMLVFQLVRELLFNVVKHAGVDEARVVVDAGPSGITVLVEDDGRGFGGPPTESVGPSGFGLVSLRQRLDPLGGGLTIVSAPGDGTRVTIELPM